MTDKSGVLNEAEMDFLLTAGGPDGKKAPGSKEPGEAKQIATMRGDLQQINLADIFQTLSMSKMEGVLKVRNPLVERQLLCRNGAVRFLVPPRTATRQLGQRLVHSGLIQVDALRTALVTQRKEQMPLGDLLVKQGLVTKQQLEEVTNMQIREDLYGLFTWRHGSFEFFKGPLTSDKEKKQFEACPEFEVNGLLLEVARRSDDWQTILAAIGSLDDVPKRIADPGKGAKFSECESELYSAVNGKLTYRDLGEQSTHGLFETARAARDLATARLLGNLDDLPLAELATTLAANGEPKKAVLLVQALRDRSTERTSDVVIAMSSALEQAGERRLAGTTLLEAAQLQKEPVLALDLARRARALAPFDATTLSFLRTTLVAHAPRDSSELEKVTLDLLDALLEADMAPAALEIIEDARLTGAKGPQLLLREARIRQKQRDIPGAASCLQALATHYEQAKDRIRAVETYEALLRLDRSRKDIQKHLDGLKRTKGGRLLRIGAVAIAVVLLGGMGKVYWDQHAFESAIATANKEIDELLAQGNRAQARERWDYWSETLGMCEPIEDLRGRIVFADAAERGKLLMARRQRVNNQLSKASDALAKGELRGAFALAGEVWKEPHLHNEIRAFVAARFEDVLSRLEAAHKNLAHRLPDEPTRTFSRSELESNIAALQALCSPVQMQHFRELAEMVSQNTLPEFVSENSRKRATAAVAEYRESFERAERLAAAYAQHLQRTADERRLDPLFKAAISKESAFDFAGALEVFRELAKQPANDAELRAELQAHVESNETICRLMDALNAATKAGDHATARQQLATLTTKFPQVPFDRIVRLPVRIDSLPNGAKVICNGADVGVTPLLLALSPADVHKIGVELDGFRPVQTTISGADTPSWLGYLRLDANLVYKHTSAVDVRPSVDGAGRLFVVERSGNLVALRLADASVLWTFASRDLSGLLSQPFVHGNVVLITSLDGELRAIDRSSGKLDWAMPDLPTEIPPVLIDTFLVIATTDARLQLLDLNKRAKASAKLAEPACAVMAHGSTLIAVGELGLITAYSVPMLDVLWQRRLADLHSPTATLAGNKVVVADDQGRVQALELATGKPSWARQLADPLGGPVATGRDVVVATPNKLYRLDIATGEDLKPIDRTDQDWSGQPVVIGDRLVAPLRDGPLQVLDRQSGNALYRLEAGKRCRLHVVGRSLFVDTAEHTLLIFHELR
ncbi:MAG TPA: DUF4388 domain-containing protein [Planctomycetota bacterium]|nr:DUF4388 domain-containing protein [Planctomycetota bacterium]